MTFDPSRMLYSSICQSWPYYGKCPRNEVVVRFIKKYPVNRRDLYKEAARKWHESREWREGDDPLGLFEEIEPVGV